MKKIFLFIVLLSLTVLSSARTYVLVTGVSNYGDSNNLAQTTKDAKAFQKVMLTQTKDVTLLTSSYANKDNILEKLRRICNQATKEDRIIFFYSGHGTPGGLYVHGGNVLWYNELVSLLGSSRAKEKICFIDACHAGSITGKTVEDARSKDESWIKVVKDSDDKIFYVACRSDEYSFENAWVGAGFFTQGLIKGLRGKSDTDHNKEVTVIELFKYIHQDVTRRSGYGQHPQLIASEDKYNVVVAKW